MKVPRFISGVRRFLATAGPYDRVMYIIEAIVGLAMAILFLFDYAAFSLFAPVLMIFLCIAFVCYLSIDLRQRRNEI